MPRGTGRVNRVAPGGPVAVRPVRGPVRPGAVGRRPVAIEHRGHGLQHLGHLAGQPLGLVGRGLGGGGAAFDEDIAALHRHPQRALCHPGALPQGLYHGAGDVDVVAVGVGLAALALQETGGAPLGAVVRLRQALALGDARPQGLGAARHGRGHLHERVAEPVGRRGGGHGQRQGHGALSRECRVPPARPTGPAIPASPGSTSPAGSAPGCLPGSPSGRCRRTRCAASPW